MSARRLLAVLCGVTSLCGAAGAAAQEAGASSSEATRPKPWGVGTTYYYQTQPYGLESLTLGLPGIDPSLAETLDVDNTTETELLTIDHWVLPFLNLQALAGRIKTETRVELSAVNIGIPLADLDVKSEGLVYGGGATLGYGTDRIFGTFTGQYTAAILDEEDASVTALVLSPRLGFVAHPKVALYAGAMYQRPSEKHAGRYAVPPFGTIEYSVKVTSSNRWNGLVGATVALTPQWLLTAEGGFGKRHSLLAHLDYRW